MMEPPKNSKTTLDAYSGLDLTIHVNNILIHLVRQFLHRFLDIVRSHLGMRRCSGRSRRSDMSPVVAFVFISSEHLKRTKSFSAFVESLVVRTARLYF
jgi:hypothetical protein